MTDKETLEHMIDQHGLCAVVDKLAEICAAKAEHIRENWQDKASALNWTKASVRVNSLHTKLQNIQGL